MTSLGLQHYLLLSSLLFMLGLFGAMAKRNVISVLLCIEIMLNAVNINFIAFNKYLNLSDAVGQIFSLFVIVVAAAEVAIGLAIAIALYKDKGNIELNNFNLLRL